MLNPEPEPQLRSNPWTDRFSRLIQRVRSSDFLGKIFETFSTRILLIIIGMVFSILVARYLGPENRGLLAVVLTLTAIGLQFGNLGLHVSNTYYVAKDRSLLPALLGNSLFFGMAMGSTGALIAWLIFSLFPHLAPVHGVILILALVSIPLGLMNQLMVNLLQGLQQIRTCNLQDIITTSFGFILLIVFLKTLSVELLLIFSLIQAGILFVWALYSLLHQTKALPKLSLSVFKNNLSYGIKAYLSCFFAYLLLRSDILMVDHFLGFTQTGFYSIAASLADKLYLLPTAIATVLFPRISALHNIEDKWKQVLRVSKVLGIVMTGIAGISIVVASPLVQLLFGTEYLPAATPFMILALAMVFYGINGIISIFYSAIGFPWFSVYIWLIAFVVNIALNVVLIKPMGISGAAVSSLICYATVLFAQLLYAERMRKKNTIQVTRDFDKVYGSEEDPWKIGDANGERYNLYYDLVRKHSNGRNRILDIGCGFGAFLSRFRDDYEKLFGIELAELAISKGKKRFPFIHFHQGSAEKLDEVALDARDFDVIIYSDVIAYFDEKGKKASLQWISDHVSEEGIALIAAWSPGEQYLKIEEFRHLVSQYFKIEQELILETQHAAFVCRKKLRYIAITIDYETWHPLPEDKNINWDNDIFLPTERLMKLGDEEEVKLTFMAEMGEYFWLRANLPGVAEKMEEQWKEIVRRGHDVQLHFHPNWLPELGASCSDGLWQWDWTKARAADYEGDLDELIGRCKEALEKVMKSVDPAYSVTSFRAGAYSVQPFKRLYDALVKNGIFCDTSVYAGGCSEERGYDFSHAYSNHQPYFANAFDPQLKAPPCEQGIVELPIFTYNSGERWFLDNDACSIIADRLNAYLKKREMLTLSSEQMRRFNEMRSEISEIYWHLRKFRKIINRFIPRAYLKYLGNYDSETLAGHDYFVMIGHTKADHDIEELRKNFRRIREDNRFRFVTLSDMASNARAELRLTIRSDSREEADYQVNREYKSILGEERNDTQSHYLQNLIPWDCRDLLDLGCGAGYWSHRIASLYPWMKIVGVDWGKDFIEKAQKKYSNEKITFQSEDFGNLSLADESFDCVYADNVLEHAYDVDRVLAEIHRVLRPGGILTAAVPSDGINPANVCDNHTWKTIPGEVTLRLKHAGFTNIEIREVDTFRDLGTSPFLPSHNIMMYITARKSSREMTKTDRVMRAMKWVYENLSPEKSQEDFDPIRILTKGYAYCLGSAIVLGKLLEREGYNVSWITMLARNHPRGRGEEKIDSHEVIQVELDGRHIILDPMANTAIHHPFREVLRNPELAVSKKDPDERYLARSYSLYDTEFWYSKVFKFAIRKSPNEKIRYQTRENPQK